jgi:hypothetical protein
VPPTLPPEQAPAKRDIRIDRIGFASELSKHFIDPLKKAVKRAHKVGAQLVGDYFQASIDPHTDTEIPPEAWLKLWNDGKISRADYLRGLKVKIGEAGEILDEKTFNRIAKKVDGTARLNIDRIPGVESGLVVALKGLNTAVEEESAGSDAVELRRAA